MSPSPAPVSREPVVVFSTGSADAVAIAKSLLMSADIEFWVMGEELQDLFGYGRFPTRMNLLIGPMKVVVAPEDAQDAFTLLAGLAEQTDEAAACGESEERDSLALLWPGAAKAARIVAYVLVGLAAFEFLYALAGTRFGF